MTKYRVRSYTTLGFQSNYFKVKRKRVKQNKGLIGFIKKQIG